MQVHAHSHKWRCKECEYTKEWDMPLRKVQGSRGKNEELWPKRSCEYC